MGKFVPPRRTYNGKKVLATADSKIPCVGFGKSAVVERVTFWLARNDGAFVALQHGAGRRKRCCGRKTRAMVVTLKPLLLASVGDEGIVVAVGSEDGDILV